MHTIYPRPIGLFRMAKELGFMEWGNQDCIILLSILVLSVFITSLTVHQSFPAACNNAQPRRCALSLSAASLLSPSRTILGTKKQLTPQSAMRGTMMMNTARTPFILASASASDVPAPEERTLPSLGRADCVTANCTAVLTASPVTAPSIRIKFRVLVATARSCGLQCAWSATRAAGMSVEGPPCWIAISTYRAGGRSRFQCLQR